MRRVVLTAMLGSLPAVAAEPLPTGGAHEQVHVPASDVPVRGPRFAPVTLDVYLAFGQPQSTAAAELARRAVARADDVRERLHLCAYGPAGADLIAEAAYEAQLEDRFWPFLDRLLADGRMLPGAGELLRLGRESGLDGERLAAALSLRSHRDAVALLGPEMRAKGHLPGELAVNGRRSAPSEESLAAAVRAARVQAQLLLDAGVPLSRLYERLVEDLDEEAQSVPSLPRTRRRLAVDDSGSPARGPSLAPLTIVTFGNPTCAGCAELAEAVRRLREAHPGQVREVWKHWVPPYALFGPDAAAAELAAGAAAQGRFWELHDSVFAREHKPLSRPELEAIARSAGVDLDRLRREAQAGTLRAAVERDQSEARKLGLGYGPALLVNGLVIAGSSDIRLETLAREELSRGLYDRLRDPH